MKEALTFGSPDLHDATASLDNMVDEVSSEIKDFVRKEGPNIVNRPLGTKPVSTADQAAVYQSLAGNVQGKVEMIMERAQQVGQAQAFREYIRWARTNNRRQNDAI